MQFSSYSRRGNLLLARAHGGAREFSPGENFMHMRRKWILYKRAGGRGRGRKCVRIDQWYVMGRVGY